MRKFVAPLLVGVPAVVIAATAWAAPPPNARPLDGSVQFGAVGAGQPAPVEDSIAPGAIAITAGGQVTFNRDGAHQPLVYRLQDGESYADAFAKLDARADETVPNPNGTGTLTRRRMAGQDQFIAPTATPPAADELTEADRDFGFRYLTETKVPPAIVAPDTSPPLGAGKYILLCNFKAHYKGVFQGQPFSMRATLAVDPDGPPA